MAAVFEQGRTLDDAIDKMAVKLRLSDDDRRWVHAVCATVFRNLRAIDAVLLRIMDRSRPPSPKLLHQLLRVGVAQLLYMDVAAHAAVHTCVEAAGSLHLSRQKSLVNAVLRSVQRQCDDLRVSIDAPLQSLDKLPGWLRERWVRNYSLSTASAIARVVEQEAPVDLTFKNLQAEHEWGQSLAGETLIAGSMRMRGREGHITSWPGFDAGAWWVQDLAASLPIRCLGDIADKDVLDVCAAPGGKTLQLAAAGARVTALDVSAARMRRVQENIARVVGENRVRTEVTDALHWRTDDRFDVVVLDAPCSSTGTLRRHAEHPWIHCEKSVLKNALIQRDLLRRAADLLRPHGVILYITCSLEPEEGENQVEEFLKTHSDFSLLMDIPAAFTSYVSIGAGGIGHRTLPHLLADKGGMDGFFFARLQKQ